MVIKALMRLFGGGSSEPKQEAKTPAASSEAAKKPASGNTSAKKLEDFVDYVVKALVDNPSDVKIVTEAEGEGKVIKITCRKEDVGKIVGKKGKTIIALRSLVGGAASRMQEKISVEVVD